MSKAADEAWGELNERQRTYLTVFYRQDQALEAERARRAAAGRYDSAPARVWRRISFNDLHSPVASALRAAGVYDVGAGATLGALRARGLIETVTVPGVLDDLVYVWLTRAGRAAARAGLGHSTPRRPPRGLLSQRLWRQLAAVAAAEATGGRCTRLAGETHLNLCVGYEQFGSRGYLQWHSLPAGGYYEFTDDGRAHYQQHHATYRQLYPAVDCPALPTTGGDS